LILELDVGNTRAKWRLIEDVGNIVARGVGRVDEWLEGDFPADWRGQITSARVASVLAADKEEHLLARIQDRLAVLCRVARSAEYCSGVYNAYPQPQRLGVDRWLALIAAHKLASASVMVVDAGTALKVDVVDGAGRHLGGYIVPGSTLMVRALFEGTDRVRFAAGNSLPSLRLGADTRDCVQNGVAAALVGAVLVAFEQGRMNLGQTPEIYVTGGGGERLHELLNGVGLMSNLEPDLVLDGLRWVLP